MPRPHDGRHGAEVPPLEAAIGADGEEDEDAFGGMFDPREPEDTWAEPDAEAAPFDPKTETSDTSHPEGDAGREHNAGQASAGLDLAGTDGNDSLGGGMGDDTLFGGYGDDLLVGEAGDDRLADGAGDDTLVGGDGDDILNATPADGEAARDERDILDGGAGDDTLILSSADIASGGSGSDSFLVGPGLTPPMPPDSALAPTITDFDAEEDALVVVWNDYTDSAPPELSIMHDEQSPGLVHLMGDGEVLARIEGGSSLTLECVHLRAASTL